MFSILFFIFSVLGNGQALGAQPAIAARTECAASTSCTYHANCGAQSPRRVYQPQFCMLENGFTGVCCSQPVGAIAPANNNVRINVQRDDGNRFEQRVEQIEDELQRNQLVPLKNTLEFSHQNFFGVNRAVLREVQKASHVLQAYIAYAKRENIAPSDLATARYDIRSSNLADVCEVAPSCANDILYRHPEGICNNLLHSTLGKAVSAFARLLPPDYADGVNAPRIAKDGGELPNPRLISLTISPDASISDGRYTLMVMQFGQFVDHDVSRTAVVKTHNNKEISCCTNTIQSNPRLQHPACFAIPVPEQDSFLRSAAQGCINFVRAAPAINNKCTFGPREQLNQLSSYLDGDNVYGASHAEERRLRSFLGGQLQVSIIHNQPFLPTNANASNCQIPKSKNFKCFLGGDVRVNEVPDLAVLNAIFLREHNRIASQLARLNAAWPDEILFQETKRIVIAEMQHIIYAEFLPILLGERSMAHFRLELSNGFTHGYNPAIDPSMLNEFATVAYRLHSLIQGNLDMRNANDRTVGVLQLKHTFSNPEVLYQKGAFDMRVAGLVGQSLNHFDNFFHSHITNHLFQIAGKNFGLDLVALDIQRGRDHGIPGYMKYRQICGLSTATSFTEMRPLFTHPDVADVMSQLYRDVDDVDLFVAGSSERPLPGGIVGPTFACIIGEQFRRIKDGDRFWYENGGLETSFTAQQLAQIKRISLSKILCDNSGVDTMQPNAFFTSSANRPKVPCDQIAGIDLSHWIQ